MITVKRLIQELKKYPSNAVVHAYEGEVIGIVVSSRAKDGKVGEELGFIPASEYEDADEGKPVAKPRKLPMAKKRNSR